MAEPNTGAGVKLPEGFTLAAFSSLDSTNTQARRMAEQGASSGLVVLAQEQSAGRGRRGRAWVSPPGNLFMSVLIEPARPLPEAAQLSFVAGLSLAEALTGFAPRGEVRCKWPNDVLVGGAKIAGMLLETAPVPGASQPMLILGLGVNVRHHPAEALYPATDLAAEGVESDAAEILSAFLDRFAPRLAAWQEWGFKAVRGDWLAHAKGVGENVVVRLEREELTGRFAGLDEDGALLLEREGEPARRILAGDVFFPDNKG